MSKYHAKRTMVDGIEFASQREAARYKDLLLLARSKEFGCVKHLERQVRYPLTAGPDNVVVGHYVADFVYSELQNDGRWLQVVEDCKGVRTPVYRLKKKLMWACYDIEIRET